MSRRPGFTLIELLLYTALVSLLGIASIAFSVALIRTRVKSQVMSEVVHNGRFSSRLITTKLASASAVTSLAPTDLCLTMLDPSENPTRLYLSGSRLYLGWGGGGSCTSTTFNEPLTSSSVIVTNLVFTDASTLGTNHVNYSYTVTSAAGIRKEWQYAQNLFSSVELR